ncbi:unnamed protein product [Ilex paraguariensis]|uniref:Cytochrome P450 n=1 Tax=Ilex paraguariensis TaxID=185542 RepID=A0ABC8T1N6_9AQUA
MKINNNTLVTSFYSSTLFPGSQHMVSIESPLMLLSFSFSILLLVAILFFLFVKYKYKSIGNKNKSPLPPGPKPWPIVGNLPEMLRNKPVFQWIHNLMDEMNTEIACIRLGNVHVITVTSPELGREFLKNQDAIFSSRPICMAAELASNGYLAAILVPFGEQWKKMRRILASEVLSPAKHRWLQGKRDEEADHLVRYVYNQCKTTMEGGVVNVRIATQHYCGNVIRKMIFGKRFFGKGMEDGGPGVEEEEHVAGLFTILGYLYSFCISDYLPCLRVFDIDGHEKIMKKALGTVRKYHDPEIDQRIGKWKEVDAGSEVGLSDPELKMFSFSTGRRGCAGVTLGSTMTAMLLARLLQGFTWKFPPCVSSIDLREAQTDLSLAHPLLALAQPRLAGNLYIAA